MKRKRLWIALTVLAALLMFAAAALDQRLIVRKYVIDAAQITEPVRLAVLTDYHGCDYGEDAKQLVRAIGAESPDVVLLVGDIYDDALPWAASDALVHSLAQRWSCFYVSGNHEYWTERIDEICRRISDAGVTVLDMNCQIIEVRGQRLNLCGVPDPYAMVYDAAPATEVQLVNALTGADAGAYTILLAHRPELIDKYAQAGFDLVVSGHAHGGQVRLPGLLNGLYAPNQGWLPRYAGGLYDVGGTRMVVSRGLARESTRLPRIFNRPELVIIDLH